MAIVITLNGTSRSINLSGKIVVADVFSYIDAVDQQAGCAVAVNGAVIRRSSWSDFQLSEGDIVEVILPIVGG